MSQLLRVPFEQFFDVEGEPLEAGYIYIGAYGLEPETNPINIYYDSDNLYPAANPVRTLAGYPARDGSVANIFIDSPTYSIKVLDKNKVLMYSELFQDAGIADGVINADNLDPTEIDEIDAKLGSERWIIIGSQDNADYANLEAYIAVPPTAGDQVLITESQTITAQLVIPSDINPKFVGGASLICNTNIATSVLQLGSDINIEGILNIVLGQTGTTAKAVEYNGDNVSGKINVENSSTGTLTTAHHINASKTGNQVIGFVGNTGGGVLTNIGDDSSGEDSNNLQIIDGVSNQVWRSRGAYKFREGLEFDLGSDANGDTYFRNSGILDRLPIGNNNEYWRSDGSTPEWSPLIFDYNWYIPAALGSGLNIPGISSVCIAAMNNTDVAFLDLQLDSLRCYRFDGSTWFLVGSGFTITLGPTDIPALTRLTNSDIAFISSVIKELRTYRFNGSTWSLLGSALSITLSSTPSLATLSSTDVALSDAVSIRTYRFNGSTWSQVGNTFSLSGGATSDITALSSNTIAYIDPTNDDLRVYSFDGTDWSLVGNELNISGLGGNPSITALNSRDVVLVDDTSNTMRIYRWDGTDWSLLPRTSITIAGAGDAYITALNGQDIAYIDVSLENLQTYRWPFSLSIPHQINA